MSVPVHSTGILSAFMSEAYSITQVLKDNNQLLRLYQSLGRLRLPAVHKVVCADQLRSQGLVAHCASRRTAMGSKGLAACPVEVPEPVWQHAACLQLPSPLKAPASPSPKHSLLATLTSSSSLEDTAQACMTS
jgi:hypothetical protein